VAGLRRWTDQDLRAFAVFWVGGFLVSLIGATVLLSSIDDGAEACTTGRIDTIEPIAWTIVAIVLVAVTMLGSWLRPPLWPLWVGLALGANLWLYSIALTLDAC
jgi:hypothetical protein